MTTDNPPTQTSTTLEEKAEEVRAYLVAVRGGAPFLSAADGRLLVRWLEQGISVARILASVDEVAEKRRKKMTRGRLTLTACRRSVEGRRPSKPTPLATNEPKPTINFSEFVHELEAMTVPPNLYKTRLALIEELKSLGGSHDPEYAATTAVAACRRFQERAWLAAEEEHTELRTQARDSLAALKNVLNPAAFEAAVDEVARDLVRRRYPLVSARSVWDRVSAV